MDIPIQSNRKKGRPKKHQRLSFLQPSDTQASSSSPKGIESDEESEDEVLSKRPRIESDQNEAFDSESCENCDSKMTKKKYSACPNKCGKK